MPPNLTRSQAAIGCARADTIAWLHRDRELLESTMRAARPFDVHGTERQRGGVLRDLAAELGPQEMKAFQAWAVQTHFWCELLARAAYALKRFRDQDHYERARQAVQDALVQRAHPDRPGGLDRTKAIESAVRLVWTLVLPAVVAASRPEGVALPRCDDLCKLIWPIRVLALMICADPSEHRAVSRYCLDPICAFATAKVRPKVWGRLAQTLPADWIPFIAVLSSGPAGAAAASG